MKCLAPVASSLLVLLCSIASPDLRAAEPTELVKRPRGIGTLRLHDGAVYWSEDPRGEPPADGRPGGLHRVDLDSRAVTTLFSGSPCGDLEATRNGIVFEREGGRVLSVVPALGGEPPRDLLDAKQLATALGATDGGVIGGIEVDDERAVLTFMALGKCAQGGVVSVPLRGGEPTILARGCANAHLQLFRGHVYWTDQGSVTPPGGGAALDRIVRVPVGGGPVEVLGEADLFVEPRATADGVFWPDRRPATRGLHRWDPKTKRAKLVAPDVLVRLLVDARSGALYGHDLGNDQLVRFTADGASHETALATVLSMNGPHVSDGGFAWAECASGSCWITTTVTAEDELIRALEDLDLGD